MIPREAITGLVLCGGRGSRMGGLDKGLLPYRGQALAERALDRLRPQVGMLLISANRNIDLYSDWGVPVVCDTLPDHPGPLAGLLAGLEQSETDWLACVPCDAPWFPHNLVARLAQAASAAGRPCAVAFSLPQRQIQPVFAIVHRRLGRDLRLALEQGQRKAGHWWRMMQAAHAEFDDSASTAPSGAGEAPQPGSFAPFDNLNTLDDLRR